MKNFSRWQLLTCIEEKKAVRITAAAWQLYKDSIAKNPPETFALLGGDLSDGLTITDFFFLPPMTGKDGRFVANGSYVYPDHNQLNYMIDNVLVRNGRYMLGLWHSHPGGSTSPSLQDLKFCQQFSQNDDSQGRNWNTFIAPITTFDHLGNDQIHLWTLSKGENEFRAAKFEVIEDVKEPIHVPNFGPPQFGSVEYIGLLAEVTKTVAKLADSILVGSLGPIQAHAISCANNRMNDKLSKPCRGDS